MKYELNKSIELETIKIHIKLAKYSMTQILAYFEVIQMQQCKMYYWVNQWI